MPHILAAISACSGSAWHLLPANVKNQRRQCLWLHYGAFSGNHSSAKETVLTIDRLLPIILRIENTAMDVNIVKTYLGKPVSTRQNFYPAIARLTVPIIVQNLISAAVNSADVVMLNFVGQDHISAVSLAAQYSGVLFMVFYGLGTGLTMLCAQYFGKGNHHAIDVVEGIALRFAVAVSALFALSAVLVPHSMMRLFTPDQNLTEIGAAYLRGLAPGWLCWGTLEVYLYALRSVGRAGTATALNVSALSANILLNAVFIFGLFGAPKMGAPGVAVATSLSRGLELCLVLIVSSRSKDVKLTVSHFFMNSPVLFRDFLKMALPALANDVSWSLAFSMYSVIIGRFLGKDMVAANAFVSQIRGFGTVLCFSVASAGGILLGQILGEGRVEDAKQAAAQVMRLTLLFGAVGGAAILASAPAVLSFADLTETGRSCLRVMLYINSYYVMGAAVNTTLIAGVFRSGGDSRFGFVCDTIDMWCYAVPLGFLTAGVLKLPPLWVYFLLCTDEFVKWPWVIRRYRSGAWAKNITRDFPVSRGD